MKTVTREDYYRAIAHFAHEAAAWRGRWDDIPMPDKAYLIEYHAALRDMAQRDMDIIDAVKEITLKFPNESPNGVIGSLSGLTGGFQEIM